MRMIANYVDRGLAQAGRHADVIALAVNGPEPLPIRDQMQRLQVTRRRLNLAMHANTLLGQGAEAVRLTLLAAEAARSDGAVTALVRENPELAACYGDAENVARLYTRPENSTRAGGPGASRARRTPPRKDCAEGWLT